MTNAPFHVWHGKNEETDAGISAFHTHTAHELLFILQGEIEMHIAGKQYRLRPGQMAVINAVEVHDLHPLSYPYERIGIHITSPQLQKVAERSVPTEIVTNHGEGFCHVFDFGESAGEVEALVKGMWREFSVEAPFAEEVLSHRFCELLVWLYRASATTAAPCRPDALIAAICRYIDAHFAEDISVEELAKMHFFSTQHFIRRFRAAVGYTPKRYLILRRLAESRVLLCTTDTDLSAVAAQCGFADAGSFVRCFRKESGITPGVYRHRYVTGER